MPSEKFQVGGSRFGASFLGTYRTCPMKWFNQHYRPVPSGGVGLEPVDTSVALIYGWAMHEALAEYYRSGFVDGVDTGIRDAVRGSNTLIEALESRRAENPEGVEKIFPKCEGLFTRYVEYDEAEKDVLRVLADSEGNPLIECDYEIKLGYKDFIFTTRFDGICRYHGQVYSFEHKTAAASRVGSTMSQLGINAQGSGQTLILKTHFPQWDPKGVLANILVKDRGRSTKPEFIRSPCGRNPMELEQFRLDAVKTLQQVEHDVEKYESLRADGMDVDNAARMVFQMHTHQCVMFGNCPYYGMCKSIGYESKMIGADFVARTP